MELEKKRIGENLRKLAFPRLFGSAEEKKAYNYVKNEIETLGLNPQTQIFSFSNFYSIIYPRVLFSIIFWLLLCYYLNLGDLFLTINVVLGLGVFLMLFIFIKTDVKYKIGKKYESQNLYVRLSRDKENHEHKFSQNIQKEIIFLAHIDSKGQRFDIVDRVRMYVIWSYSIVISVAYIIFKNIIFPQYTVTLYIFGAIPIGLNFYSLMLIYLNTTNNKSSGALDDASGVVCLLEILQFYANGREGKVLPKNYNLWFVFTGAEECGTNGVKHFHQIIKKYRKKDLIIINLDSIGTKMDFIKFGKTNHRGFQFQKTFHETAEEMGIEIPTRRVPIGVHTDGYFFFNKGYKGVEFGDWDSYKYLHSVNDTIDKVDPLVLKNVCEIIIKSLEKIDKNKK